MLVQIYQEKDQKTKKITTDKKIKEMIPNFNVVKYIKENTESNECKNIPLKTYVYYQPSQKLDHTKGDLQEGKIKEYFKDLTIL